MQRAAAAALLNAPCVLMKMAEAIGTTTVDDLELDAEDNGGAVNQSPSVRKNISLKLKGKSRGGRGRKVGRGVRKGSGRTGKSEQEREEDPDDDRVLDDEPGASPGKPHQLGSVEEESGTRTKLESPCSLTTLERNFTEPLHQNKQLNWNHKVNLIGEKLLNPMIHCCEECNLPILIYGRMIPCKHVFCLDCAKKSSAQCPRCSTDLSRVEPSSLGTIFVCMHGAARHSNNGCRRTYLSQRDLQAHINHRHKRQGRPSSRSTVSSSSGSSGGTSSLPPVSSTSNNSVPPPPPQAPPPLTARDPRGSHLGPHEGPSHTPPPHSHTLANHPPPPHPLPNLHLSEYRQEERNLLTSGAPPSLQQPPPSNRPATHLYSHPPPSTPTHTHTSYPSPIPVVSTRSNLITVPIQDDSSSSPHMHPPPPQAHISTYASQSPGHPAPLPPQHQTVSAYTTPPPPTHHYPPAHSTQPPPPYSQPQTFNPPTHIPPPTIHNPNPPPPLFTGPPPPVVHHAPPPPVSYNPPPIRQHSLPPPPPQRFPGPTAYEDSPYPPSWGTSRPPPPAHAPLPPRPLGAPPSQPDPGYRPPPSYYP